MTGDIPNANSFGSRPCPGCGMWISCDPYNQHVCQGFPAPNAPLPGLDWSKAIPGQLTWVPNDYKPTQREYFAARAMQGLLANRIGDTKGVAIEAVLMADAVIAELVTPVKETNV